MTRMIFVDEEEDAVLAVRLRRMPPQDSLHWQHLHHLPGDALLADAPSLLQTLQDDLYQVEKNTESTAVDSQPSADGRKSKAILDTRMLLATWSCIFGYCEALTTHKDPLRRFDIFPVPIDALRRLIQEEFVPMVQTAVGPLPKDPTISFDSSTTSLIPQQIQDHHRQRVQAISNAIWQQTLPKANVRDELHANSVYACLRGKALDKKSLDCFGAAVTTIAGLHCLEPNDPSNKTLHVQSYLTLSEDHAYERHAVVSCQNDNQEVVMSCGTCEVAIPGTTNLAKSKRGREIVFTLESDKNTGGGSTSSACNTTSPNQRLAPESSWLYMAKNPVVCTSIPMTLAAIVGNINPTIEMPSSAAKPITCSKQLYQLKRDLLWVLYDRGHLTTFPFGLMELSDCEEHCGTLRGEQEVDLSSLDFVKEYQTIPSTSPPLTVTQIEQLLLEALHINRSLYDEAQVYPYFYAGHFHKDAGKELGHDDEYRLVESMYLYSRATHVASGYPYHTGCIQLNKHMTSAAALIAQEMLTVEPEEDDGTKSKNVPRIWHHVENAVAFGTWLLGFYDALLYWEETSGKSTHFVEILHLSHNHSFGKVFALLSLDIRLRVLEKVQEQSAQASGPPTPRPLIQCLQHGTLSFFGPVRSKRLSPGGLLWTALSKTKLTIPEMAMAIPTSGPGDEEGGTRSSRRAKRPKR
jgi:Menin